MSQKRFFRLPFGESSEDKILGVPDKVLGRFLKIYSKSSTMNKIGFSIGNAAENLAPESRIELCNSNEADKRINDGDTSLLAVTISSQCLQADIEIHLDGSYVIHWVMLYGGTSEKHGLFIMNYVEINNLCSAVCLSVRGVFR